MAAPVIYTPRKLKKAVEKYFNSITRTVSVKDLGGAPIVNNNGEVMQRTEYILPPSTAALALSLGICTSTWTNYSNPKLHPEFTDICRYAHDRMEAYNAEQLLLRDKPQGVIFNLEHNFGWKQKLEVAVDEETRKDMKISEMSLDEKMAIIAQALQGNVVQQDEQE